MPSHSSAGSFRRRCRRFCYPWVTCPPWWTFLTIRFYDLRHDGAYADIGASLLIQNGEPLAYIKEQLGHSSIQITVDVYGHLEPGRNMRAR